MKLKRKVFVPAVLLIMAIAAGAVVFVSTGRQKPSPRPLKVMSDNVDVEIKDILFTEIGDGSVKWEIKASTARYLKGANLALFEGVRVTLLPTGGGKYVLSGDRGEFRTDTKDIKLTGHVKIITERGDILTAERLQYANGQRRIVSDGPVIVESGRLRVNGEGMHMDIARQEVSLLAKVRANIK
jgi:LPS export ABC transporter protein LptC